MLQKIFLPLSKTNKNMDFKTLPQLLDFFKDEQTCRDYLEQQRWAGAPVCPFCLTEQPYRTNRGFKCRNKECHKKFTVTVGTIYENSKVALRTWFAAVYLCTAHKKGISSCQLARDLGITQKTAWFVLHRIREMLREKAPKMLNEQIQIDEAYIGGLEKFKHNNKRTKNTTGRSQETKTPVIGIYGKGGQVVIKVTPWVTKKAVRKLIDVHVQEKSTMVTDGYAMYAFLTIENKFDHVMVDHSKGQYVDKNGFHTNGIENFWSILKRGIIGIYHYVSPGHLQRYCDEFAARYNTRGIKDAERFILALQNSEGRLKYNELIAKA